MSRLRFMPGFLFLGGPPFVWDRQLWDKTSFAVATAMGPDGLHTVETPYWVNHDTHEVRYTDPSETT